MSKIAQRLASSPATTDRVPPGPRSDCSELYGPGDLEDYAAIQEYRQRPGETWKTTQRRFDELLGTPRRIHNDKFRYHWNRRCACWTDEQRHA